ncbi:MAG: redoxin domain-containing protein [Alphaproteobacteria bacterium]|nr:redoxin domain-containing protein [Alphaproteobacteria bacterium]
MPGPGEPAPPLRARPVFGLEVDLAAWTARGPAVVVFLRYLGSPFTRASLARLQAAFPRLDVRGIGVVALTDSPLAAGRDFVPRHHLLFPVICDPERALYRAWGVDAGGLAGALAGLARGGVALEALRQGHGRVDGRWASRPSAFLVAPGGEVAWAWRGAHPAAVVPVDEVVERAEGLTG